MGQNKQTDGEFAQSVVKLFQWNIAPPAKQKRWTAEAARDVRRCANGLALIHLLLARFMEDLAPTKSPTRSGRRPPDDAFAASGISDAFAIMAHLTTGHEHPIARHVRGLQSGAFRPQKAPANEFDLLVRTIFAGAVLAVAREEKGSRERAIKALVGWLQAKKSEFLPTEAAVRGWVTAAVRDPKNGAETFANEFKKRADSNASSALEEALKVIVAYTAVASPVCKVGF